ncbi:PilZ domain-containing protein [Kineobactrum salinum]|uniref:Metal-dependent phosphohydrolase n=1 Tax=Kineobactrum salinum TaxID=2708301 RepID=A0A6C0U4X7_9GAMM|nr:PilZ domain-containing protein [Kineobactrum salinum]QIB66469.1 metal-dependent phosphohydrolase [Kineobactrum salinum]
MASPHQHTAPAAKVISSLLQNRHEISVYAKEMPYSLSAQAVELTAETGHLVLSAEYAGQDIESYFKDGCLNLDIEALKGHDATERDVYSLSNIPVNFSKTGHVTYRLECELPQSVFVEESRGAVRIPFILGMHSRVSVEVYLHELSIEGRLRNLSVGGCLIDIAIEDSVALGVDQELPGVTIEFPNGESFHAEGRVRHLRPFGNHGYAAIGVEFINITSTQTSDLFHFTAEVEREAAFRAGINDKMTEHSPLFVAGAREKKLQQREELDGQIRNRQSKMERGVLEVAHQLQVALMYIKTRAMLPKELLYDCADSLLYLVYQDRKALLYALSFLREEPEWVRHAVQVAAQSADFLLMRNPHDGQVREITLGILLHTLGKPLLVSRELPSLRAHMSPEQKRMLKQHSTVLGEKLKALGFQPSPTCRDVLENANERLDGSGYPAGKRDADLSDVIRLISVVKAVNKLSHARNGVAPRAPLDVYRCIHEESTAYDRTVLVEFIQHYGLYPIGALARFSGGFLAWIMDVDGRGNPTKVHVVKNLKFMNENIHSTLTTVDFSQIGKLEGIVNPEDYGVRHIKI